MSKERRLQLTLYLRSDVLRAIEKLAQEEDVSRNHILSRLIRKGLVVEAKQRGQR